MATKRKAKTKKSGLPAKSTATVPAIADMERDAGGGFEEADRDSYAIPFLVVLQKNSPQCDEAEGAYIEEAKAGMFFNTATNELYSGKDGVVVVPAYFQRKLVEWVPRDQGGGFRGSHDPDTFDLWKLTRDDSGKFLMENGNHLVDTRYHFCTQIGDFDPQNVVISLTSTQIKKSRSWMTRMNNIKKQGKAGKPFTPPTYSHAYKLTTVGEKNEKGSWFGVRIETDHELTAEETNLYLSAKEFADQVVSGKAKVEEPVDKNEEGDF